MPKKGKGKKKKETLSEEQKKKLAEQKALAEQEKITRRREVTNAFLRLKKEKEHELILLNTNKLLDLWRPRLRKMKIEELMDDYKAMRNAFERAFDKKHNLMKDLRDNLDKNQKDYDAAVDSHMYNIDKMMEFWRQRLEEVRDAYNLERNKLIRNLEEERNRIQTYQDKSLKQLRNAMTKTQNHFQEQTADARADFAVREEEIRNKGVEEVHIIKAKMDQRMNEMWQDLHGRLVAYDVNVEAKRSEYLDYREKDMVMSSLIDAQFRRLYALREGISQMTTKTGMFDKALEHFLDQLRKKKKEYRDLYDALMTQHRQLISSMDDMISQRERLLRSIERCRKRERLDEKIDPFLLKWSLNSLVGDEMKKDQQDDATQLEEKSDVQISGQYLFHVDDIVHDVGCDCNPCTCEPDQEDIQLVAPAQKIIEEFTILERFWIRYNRVSLERAALQVRREALLKDNWKLKLALRNYLGGVNPLTQDLCTFHEEVMANEKRETQQIFRAFFRELKRRERCRKVGGIRVY